MKRTTAADYPRSEPASRSSPALQFTARVCLALMGGLVACSRTRPEPGAGVSAPDEAPSTRPWNGSLRGLAGPNPVAWISLRTDRLRADPRITRIWDAAGPAPDSDPLARALAGSDEVLFAWSDPFFESRIHFIRGAIDGDGLREALSSPTNFSGAPFATYSVQDVVVWYQGEEPWSVSLPAPNLLVTGDDALVRAAVMRTIDPPPPDAAPATPAGPPADGDIDAWLRLTETHRVFLAQEIDDPLLAARLSDLATISLEGRIGLGIDLVMTVGLAPGADAEAAARLVALLVVELGRPLVRDLPDAALARALIEEVRILADASPASPSVRLEWEWSGEQVERWAGLLAGDAPLR